MRRRTKGDYQDKALWPAEYENKAALIALTGRLKLRRQPAEERGA